MLKYKECGNFSVRGKSPKIIKNRRKKIILRCAGNGLKVIFLESGISGNKAELFYSQIFRICAEKKIQPQNDSERHFGRKRKNALQQCVPTAERQGATLWSYAKSPLQFHRKRRYGNGGQCFKCPKNFFMIRIQYFSKIIFSPKFLYGLTINRTYH